MASVFWITSLTVFFAGKTRCVEAHVATKVCFFGQEPDPSHGGKLRWVISERHDDRCSCTSLRPGAVNTRPPVTPYDPFYTDCPLFTNDQEQIYGYFKGQACSFVTGLYQPPKFILKRLSMPFRLDFTVKTLNNAVIGLAANKTQESMFAEAVIGGWTNSRSGIRPCHYRIEECGGLLVEHEEKGLVSANESRPFWIEYRAGIFTVGKGGQKEGFLEWDAGEYYGRVPTEVQVGIASWQKAPGEWEFWQFCE